MTRKFKQIVSLFTSALLSVSMMTPLQSIVVNANDEFVYDISFVNSSYNDSTRGIDFGRTGDQWKRGQSFVALRDSNIKSVEAKVISNENPGDLTAELYLCDDDSHMPVGQALATAELPKEQISTTQFTEVSIPLEYSSLKKDKIYTIVLGQKTNTGWYGWYCSYDNNNPTWWQPPTVNPQIKQKDCDTELPSYKVTETNQFQDDSRCGDLWLKVNCIPAMSSELFYDVSFVNSTYSADTKGIDFGRVSDQWKRGQTFYATMDSNLTSVFAKVIGIESPGDLTAELYMCDSTTKLPTGDKLASAEVPKENISSSEFTELRIPLSYNGLKQGNIYAVVLSQKTTSGWYGWYCSYDNSNPTWWKPPFVNPQIKQDGYDDDLASISYSDGGNMMDDSRCGDLWLKASYTSDVVPQPEDDLATQYQKDIDAGGLSFYMDRILARPGIDPSLIEDSGLMTRGRALYTKGTNENGLIKEFGFGGTMRYVKGDRTGYTLEINGKKASDFTEDKSKRTDYPSYWTSEYTGKADSVVSGLSVVTKRFITENNTAVTILDLTNTTNTSKSVEMSMLVPSCNKVNGDILTGSARVDYKNLQLKASMDGGKASSRIIKKVIQIPALSTVSQKAQMGFIDPKDSITSNEFTTYYGYTPDKAFTTQLKTYNYWWVENIPSVWVPDEYIQKMIAYRWWIARINVADAGTYNYPFTTAMEGVFGYNNAIVNAVPWQMDESRYLRSPLVGYGTWVDAAIAANGGIYKDNPAGVWGVKPQHYISKAGWENYKVHGGQKAFLEVMAKAGAGDVDGTKSQYDSDGNDLYDIQYDAWDNDTASLSVSGKQDRIDTAALAWVNAQSVSEMFMAVGNTDEADKYKSFANQIKSVNLTNSWDLVSKQFLMKKPGGDFIPYRDINNYYAFMVGMVPQKSGYDTALRVWNDNNEFPTWPMYVSNSKDYVTIQNDANLTDRTRNYSPGNAAITLKMFASAIKNYDTSNITGKEFKELLKQYTMASYVNKNINYPDTNEFWNGNSDNPYRSWIHHNWHSQYNTLVIENVMGITPRDDKIIELNPVDVGMRAFKISNVRYHNKNISVELNRDGYQLTVDNDVVAQTDRLCHFTWNSETGEVTILDDSGAVVKCHKTVADFKSAYDINYSDGRVAEVMQAATDYKPGDTVVAKDSMEVNTPDHKYSYKLVTADGSSWEDNFNLDFGDYTGSQYKRAQMFVAKNGGDITGIQVMVKNKNATKDMTVEIYDADTNNKPNKQIASTKVLMSDVPTDMGIVTADIDCILEKGKTYYVVLGQDKGGSGLYCWALSAKDMNSSVQAHQEGYDGELDMYRIEQNSNVDGNKIKESQLGDNYLEVFYQDEKIDTSKLKIQLDKAAVIKSTLQNYLETGKADFLNAYNVAQNIYNAPESQKQVDNILSQLSESMTVLKLIPKNGWVLKNNKYYYYVNDVLQKNKWINTKNGKYRTDVNGSRIAGKTVVIDKKCVLFKSSGIYADGTKIYKVNKKSYYVKNGYVVIKKCFVFKGKRYLSDQNGVIYTGTKMKTVNKKTYYVYKDYVVVNKTATYKKNLYVSDKNGVIQKGKKVVKVNGKLYYVSKSGIVKTKGTVKYKGVKYKALKNGILRKVF